MEQMAENGHKSISRIDQPKKRTHGWYVRVHFNRTTHTKWFGDATYGGPEEALAEAIQFRNETEARIGKPRTERTVVGARSRRGSRVVGVTRRQKRWGNGNGEYVSEVFEVTWNPEPGRVSRTSVSIAKYGEEEAYRRAVAIRKAKERELYGSVIGRGTK
jgi:hypothetical protein